MLWALASGFVCGGYLPTTSWPHVTGHVHLAEKVVLALSMPLPTKLLVLRPLNVPRTLDASFVLVLVQMLLLVNAKFSHVCGA